MAEFYGVHRFVTYIEDELFEDYFDMPIIEDWENSARLFIMDILNNTGPITDFIKNWSQSTYNMLTGIFFYSKPQFWSFHRPGSYRYVMNEIIMDVCEITEQHGLLSFLMFMSSSLKRYTKLCISSEIVSPDLIAVAFDLVSNRRFHEIMEAILHTNINHYNAEVCEEMAELSKYYLLLVNVFDAKLMKTSKWFTDMLRNYPWFCTGKYLVLAELLPYCKEELLEYSVDICEQLQLALNEKRVASAAGRFWNKMLLSRRDVVLNVREQQHFWDSFLIACLSNEDYRIAHTCATFLLKPYLNARGLEFLELARAQLLPPADYVELQNTDCAEICSVILPKEALWRSPTQRARQFFLLTLNSALRRSARQLQLKVMQGNAVELVNIIRDNDPDVGIIAFDIFCRYEAYINILTVRQKTKLVFEYLKSNVKISSSGFRHTVTDALAKYLQHSKLIIKLRFADFCLSQIFPGGCFQRTVTALKILMMLCEHDYDILYEWDMRVRKGDTKMGYRLYMMQNICLHYCNTADQDCRNVLYRVFSISNNYLKSVGNTFHDIFLRPGSNACKHALADLSFTTSIKSELELLKFFPEKIVTLSTLEYLDEMLTKALERPSVPPWSLLGPICMSECCTKNLLNLSVDFSKQLMYKLLEFLKLHFSYIKNQNFSFCPPLFIDPDSLEVMNSSRTPMALFKTCLLNLLHGCNLLKKFCVIGELQDVIQVMMFLVDLLMSVSSCVLLDKCSTCLRNVLQTQDSWLISDLYEKAIYFCLSCCENAPVTEIPYKRLPIIVKVFSSLQCLFVNKDLEERIIRLYTFLPLAAVRSLLALASNFNDFFCNTKNLKIFFEIFIIQNFSSHQWLLRQTSGKLLMRLIKEVFISNVRTFLPMSQFPFNHFTKKFEEMWNICMNALEMIALEEYPFLSAYPVLLVLEHLSFALPGLVKNKLTFPLKRLCYHLLQLAFTCPSMMLRRIAARIVVKLLVKETAYSLKLFLRRLLQQPGWTNNNRDGINYLLNLINENFFPLSTVVADQSVGLYPGVQQSRKFRWSSMTTTDRCITLSQWIKQSWTIPYDLSMVVSILKRSCLGRYGSSVRALALVLMSNMYTWQGPVEGLDDTIWYNCLIDLAYRKDDANGRHAAASSLLHCGELMLEKLDMVKRSHLLLTVLRLFEDESIDVRSCMIKVVDIFDHLKTGKKVGKEPAILFADYIVKWHFNEVLLQTLIDRLFTFPKGMIEISESNIIKQQNNDNYRERYMVLCHYYRMLNMFSKIDLARVCDAICRKTDKNWRDSAICLQCIFSNWINSYKQTGEPVSERFFLILARFSFCSMLISRFNNMHCFTNFLSLVKLPLSEVLTNWLFNMPRRC
ncbi:hypothetical protein T4D_8264 [Trichinella pseudospiralis]|uniref:Uncharacterized protein n=1 Tax=Trichinella pseudospiralis TaxID=6337 RepID=A0A0V1FDE2_TRIPS|nr:hypothetical protein T4D_8264 [Trichinella pseudospiralis]